MDNMLKGHLQSDAIQAGKPTGKVHTMDTYENIDNYININDKHRKFKTNSCLPPSSHFNLQWYILYL